MATLSAAFQAAAAEAQSLPSKPSNENLLKLYAFYKQATSGDVTGSRPGFTDMVGRAKYDAWAKVKGQTSEQAQQGYVDLVEQLKKG